jgi:hypothetical protein
MKESKEQMLAYIKERTGWTDVKCEQYLEELEREELKKVLLTRYSDFNNEWDFLTSLTPSQQDYFTKLKTQWEETAMESNEKHRKFVEKHGNYQEKYNNLRRSIKNIVTDIDEALAGKDADDDDDDDNDY